MFKVSVHPEDDNCIVVMKGAPEKVLERCGTIFLNNETTTLTPKLRAICDIACMELAGKGKDLIQNNWN